MGKLSRINKGVTIESLNIQLPANNHSWLQINLKAEKEAIPIDKFWDVVGKITREIISPGAPLDASPIILNERGINLILMEELKKVPFIDVHQRNKAFGACKRAIKRMDVTPKPFLISDKEFNAMQE